MPGQGIGYFVSLPGTGAPLLNTFTAYLEPSSESGDPVESVQFSLNGETQVDDTSADGGQRSST